MSSSLLLQQCPECFACLWFVRWEVSGRTAVVLYRTASRVCSKQYAASFFIYHLDFSPSVWCNYTVVLMHLQLGRIMLCLWFSTFVNMYSKQDWWFWVGSKSRRKTILNSKPEAVLFNSCLRGMSRDELGTNILSYQCQCHL